MDLSSPDIPIKQVLTAQVVPVKRFTNKIHVGEWWFPRVAIFPGKPASRSLVR